MYFNTCSNSGNINKTFIIEPLSTTGGTPVISACTAVFTNAVISCSGNTEILLTSGATVFNTDLVPTTDGTVAVGRPTRRFRELNSVSGITSIWSATTRVHTPALHLGVDSSGNTRIITANNSIIQNDCLLGGTY
jgi:hypothetical protein